VLHSHAGLVFLAFSRSVALEFGFTTTLW
jgi:hypothetical protein